MDELDKYECFGVPAHVWFDDNTVALAPVHGATRRHGVYHEAAMLGVEAIPSPLLAEFSPAK